MENVKENSGHENYTSVMVSTIRQPSVVGPFKSILKGSSFISVAHDDGSVTPRLDAKGNEITPKKKG